MHLVLHSCACPHEPRPASDTPTQGARRLVGHPHRFEHPGRQQLGQHRRVKAIGLHARMRDRSRLRRIAYHDPADIALFQQPGRSSSRRSWPPTPPGHHSADRPRTPGSPLGYSRSDRPARPGRPGDRDLAEIEVNIQTKEPHEKPPPFTNWTYEMEGTAGSDNYGFGLSAQPGKSQGRPSSH